MNAAVSPKRPRLGQLPALLRTCFRQAHVRVPRPQPQGHGEKIWVFTHRQTDQVIYSLRAQLDGFHGLKQLPFNGKKTKPAKLRKDYWILMALVKFPPGCAAIGRSVFHKLRELKHLHEVNWPTEFRLKSPVEIEDEKLRNAGTKNPIPCPRRTGRDRGIALNAQKYNAIADMSVVLAGKGKGNKILVQQSDKEGGEKGNEVAEKPVAPEKVEVSIHWCHRYLKNHAPSWSRNVRHGLLGSSGTDIPQRTPTLNQQPTRTRAEETVMLA